MQQKLREEVRMHMAGNSNPDYKDLKQMEYLDHVVCDPIPALKSKHSEIEAHFQNGVAPIVYARSDDPS